MRNFKRHLTDTLLILAIALLFTGLLLLVVGASPLEAFGQLLSGSFGSWSRLARVLNVWIPLTLCSLGLLYAFRSGLWNIGVEGQMVLGAIGCTAVLRWGMDTAAPQLMLPVALLAGLLLGSLWALLAGWLKIRGGVHEIFAGLGLNFVAMGLILWLIFGPGNDPESRR